MTRKELFTAAALNAFLHPYNSVVDQTVLKSVIQAAVQIGTMADDEWRTRHGEDEPTDSSPSPS